MTAKNKTKKTIEQYDLLNKGDHVVVGISGGPDSMCLLHILMDMSKDMDLTLEAVHINHSLRLDAADEDMHYVEDFCKDAGIKCNIFKEDCKAMAKEWGMTEEEAGRRIRYEAYAETVEALVEEGVLPDKIKVATAHNKNDQWETLMFRIIRGTGTDGLAGMDYLRRDRLGFLIIHPLLDVTREEVEAYCLEQKLAPRIDATNSQPIYMRNKIRLELIPYIQEKYNQSFPKALNRLCNVAKEDRDYLWKVAESAFGDAFISLRDDICILQKEALKVLEPAIRHRVIIMALQKVGLFKDVSYAHLRAADKLIDEGKTTRQVSFPAGFRMKINYNKVEIFPEQEREQELLHWKLKVSVLYRGDYIPRANTAVFDVDKLSEVYDMAGGPLNLIFARPRQQGDYITLTVGRKTVQDLFVDMKVPRDLRDYIYMAAIGNEILWIPEGLTRARYSSNFRVTEDTERVLILEMESEL